MFKAIFGWTPNRVRDLLKDAALAPDHPKRLTASDLEAQGTRWNVEPRLLRALTEVESGGHGFLPDGRPVILFEGHVFWKRLQARGINPREVQVYFPDLCFPSWNPKAHPYGKATDQYEKIETLGNWAGKWRSQQQESFIKAAMEACSWGLFQLLGSNYEAAGFSDIYTFASYHMVDESHQLQTILAWMSSNGLLAKLRAKNWAGFTAGYNGLGQVLAYSGKLKAAYARG